MFFSERSRRGRVDLEAVEMALRSALHQAGATALTQLLEYPAPEADHRCLPCPCGQQARYRGLRSRPLLTAVGQVQLQRPYYLCPACHQGQCPVDPELDVENTELSPGVRRMLAVVGVEAPFDHGREQMRLLAELEVTTKAVERTTEAIGEDIAAAEQQQIGRAMQLELPVTVDGSIPLLYVQMDATGVPVVKKETAGRVGNIAGQPAHTRQSKLGCVFRQTQTDEEGRPVRDPDSTTYTGAIETAEELGRRIYTEACRRGWQRAKKKVLMGDGAEWIWNLGEVYFPGSIQIVDLYHARQHLWELARQLYPREEVRQNRWVLVQQDKLDQGRIETLVASLRRLRVKDSKLADQIRTEAEYFQKNAPRMRYPDFRRQGLFVGSGVIEAGCKTVIGSRLKQSGMFWTVRGANAMIALRCCRLSRRFDDYWEARAA